MFVTHSFRIPYDKTLYEEMRKMQKAVYFIWNDIVKEGNSYYLIIKKSISKTGNQVIRKQKYNMHLQTVQAKSDKYEATRKTIQPLRQTDKKAKYPWRKKYYYCIPLKKASMTIPHDKIAIKKSEYAIELPDLLTKKKKKNWNEIGRAHV